MSKPRFTRRESARLGQLCLAQGLAVLAAEIVWMAFSGWIFIDVLTLWQIVHGAQLRHQPTKSPSRAIALSGLSAVGLAISATQGWIAIPRAPAGGFGTLFIAVCVLLAALSAVTAVAYLSYSRAAAGRSADACPTCGYDLVQSTGRCPECGAVIETPTSTMAVAGLEQLSGAAPAGTARAGR